MTNKIIAYRLEPVHENLPGGIATAAVMTCMATGETLSGMGGGGDYLSPAFVDTLKKIQQEGGHIRLAPEKGQS